MMADSTPEEIRQVLTEVFTVLHKQYGIARHVATELIRAAVGFGCFFCRQRSSAFFGVYVSTPEFRQKLAPLMGPAAPEKSGALVYTVCEACTAGKPETLVARVEEKLLADAELMHTQATPVDGNNRWQALRWARAKPGHA